MNITHPAQQAYGRRAALPSSLDGGHPAENRAERSSSRTRSFPVRTRGWLGGLAVLLLGSASALTGHADPWVWSGNLIVNGDAEASLGSTTASTLNPSGWTAVSGGTVTAFKYGGSAAYADLVASTDPLPADHGLNFFAGGSGGNVNGVTVSSSVTQSISLASYASFIDWGGSKYDLSGWLGGWENQGDDATLSVVFRNGGGTPLGSASIGPVTAAERGNLSGLLYRQTIGTIPVGTSSAELTLTMTRNLNVGSYNDGYADSLSLLVGVPEPSATIAGAGASLLGFVGWRRLKRAVARR